MFVMFCAESRRLIGDIRQLGSCVPQARKGVCVVEKMQGLRGEYPRSCLDVRVDVGVFEV